jgi:hypothetical protein
MDLVGKPYGFTFEIMPDQSLRALSRSELLQTEGLLNFLSTVEAIMVNSG